MFLVLYDRHVGARGWGGGGGWGTTSTFPNNARNTCTDLNLCEVVSVI